MMRPKFFLFFPLVLAMAAINAQSPAPVIVQPANVPAATSTTSKTVASAPEAQSIPAAIKLLEQIKAANAEVLAKQKTALEKLDELEDAADQLRIFAKRG